MASILSTARDMQSSGDLHGIAVLATTTNDPRLKSSLLAILAIGIALHQKDSKKALRVLQYSRHLCIDNYHLLRRRKFQEKIINRIVEGDEEVLAAFE